MGGVVAIISITCRDCLELYPKTEVRNEYLNSSITAGIKVSELVRRQQVKKGRSLFAFHTDSCFRDLHR